MMSWKSILSSKNISIDQIDKLAKELSKALGDKFCCLLIGNLAAGKTELVKCYGQLHGFAGVNSPTFSLHQQYVNQKSESLDHFDLYRIKSEVDLESTGFFESIQEASKVFIEWPQFFDEKILVQIHRPLYKIEIKGEDLIRHYELYHWTID